MFTLRLSLFLLFVLSVFSLTFEGDVVFRINVKERKQIEALQTLKAFPEKYDFWSELSDRRPVDLRVTKYAIEEAKKFFDEFGLSYEVMIENVQTLVDRERKTLKASSNKVDESYYEHYHTFDENMKWMSDLVDKYPNMTELVEVGMSYEGRSLVAVKVTSPNSQTKNKPVIWIDAGIHCREWISTATLIYILGHFCSDYNNDTDIQSILEQSDLYVLLMFNPDGYVYTWEHDRMWRKTRSPNEGSTCIGTDANRNFDYHWGEDGSSSDPCSTTYHGATPFSEIETKTVGQYLSSIPNLVGYINFHSYSQMWMYAWGYTYDLPEDNDDLNEVSRLSVESLSSLYGTKYTYGSVANTIYICSGIGVDWMYGELGIKYSMTVELRDTGEYGFLLPEDQIVPSGQETLLGFKTFSKSILETKK